MKILFTILFLCALLFSCKKDKVIVSHDYLIDYLVNEGPDVWPSYSQIIVFCKCDNDKIGYLDVIGLRKGFNDPKYNKLGYFDYISGVLNLELLIDSTETYRSFTINDTISKVYQDNSFERFLNTYTNQEFPDNEYRLRNDLSFNSTLTLMYYLYQNGYYCYHEDLIGTFFTHKGLPIINETENNIYKDFN